MAMFVMREAETGVMVVPRLKAVRLVSLEAMLCEQLMLIFAVTCARKPSLQVVLNWR